jgi:hypothetical protein
MLEHTTDEELRSRLTADLGWSQLVKPVGCQASIGAANPIPLVRL